MSRCCAVTGIEMRESEFSTSSSSVVRGSLVNTAGDVGQCDCDGWSVAITKTIRTPPNLYKLYCYIDRQRGSGLAMVCGPTKTITKIVRW